MTKDAEFIDELPDDDDVLETSADGDAGEDVTEIPAQMVLPPEVAQLIAGMQQQIGELRQQISDAYQPPTPSAAQYADGLFEVAYADDRCGPHPSDPKRTGRTRTLISDSPGLTVILRPSIEKIDAQGNKFAAYPSLRVQFQHGRAEVDEALLPLLRKHPSWRSQSGGVFDPMDPGAPRPRLVGPSVVEGPSDRPESASDMEPLPGWDTMDTDSLVAAIQQHRCHPMDAFNWEGRVGGPRRHAVLQAATETLVAKFEGPNSIDEFSAAMTQGV